MGDVEQSSEVIGGPVVIGVELDQKIAVPESIVQIAVYLIPAFEDEQTLAFGDTPRQVNGPLEQINGTRLKKEVLAVGSHNFGGQLAVLDAANIATVTARSTEGYYRVYSPPAVADLNVRCSLVSRLSNSSP